MNEYRCENLGRRQRIVDQPAGPGRINAIDYLVVIDGEEVPAGLRQRLLRIRFFFSDELDSLGVENVQVQGGVRVVDPMVRWITRMSDVNAPGGVATDPSFDPTLSPEDRLYLANLAVATAEPERWLLLLVQSSGDFSRYRLLLREGPGSSAPPAGFDLRLSEVEFGFKVECPTPFDCRDEPECVGAPNEVPDIDYLARDFASFRQLMFERMALTQPGEPSREAATTRAALVEVLAYAADHASYYLDAVNTEAYLAYARQRSSVRRHARMRDYAMHEGCNARVFVHIEVAPGASLVTGIGETPVVQPGTSFMTRVPRHGAVIRPDGLADALSHGTEVFEVMHPLHALVDAHNEIHLHTWGDTDCCLPAGSTRATVRDPDDRLALAAGDFVVFEEIRDRETLQVADADPAHRHVVRITEVSSAYDDTLVETNGGPTRVRDIAWHDEDALPFALIVSVSTEAVAVARGNLVLCDHGQTLQTAPSQPLRLVPFGNQGHLRGTLGAQSLSWREGYRSDASASRVVRQDPRHATPYIALEGEGEEWLPQRDLLASAAAAREFVVETESDGRVWLRFGDDVKGRRPARGATFAANFRVGNGPEGNVGAGSIAHLVMQPGLVSGAVAAVVRAVRNPLAATGGVAPESIEEVRLYAPHAFRRQERAVTEDDWAEVAARHPQVQRAVATIRWTGSWHTVFVTVDRFGGLPIDEVFVAELLEHLQRYRLAGYDLQVEPPRYVPLDIAMTVCVDSHHFVEQVEKRLYQEFSTGILAGGQRGFFHPDEISFGEAVYLSRIVSRATAVPGVRWVDLSPPAVSATTHPHRFKRRGQAQGSEFDDGLIAMGPLEIARCDNDRNLPDNGQIRFFMEGGA